MIILNDNNNTDISNTFLIVIFNFNDIILRLSLLKYVTNILLISPKHILICMKFQY